MEILFISTWFPYPKDNGSRIRIAHLLHALGQRHHVHLLAFLPGAEQLLASQEISLPGDRDVIARRSSPKQSLSDTPDDVIARRSPPKQSFSDTPDDVIARRSPPKQSLPDLHTEILHPLTGGCCTSIAVVDRDPFWRDPGTSLSAHFSLAPRDVIRGYSPEMAGLVDQAARERAFDLVIASTLEVAPYALQVKNVPKILEEHNFSTLWMQERFRAQSNPLQRAAGWVTWQKCRHYERQLYPHFAAVTMVSRRDCQAVQAAIPSYPGQLEIIPNGVDLETHRPGLAEPQPGTMVFNGSLTYAANHEAMRWFVEQVLPLIRQARPGVKLRITGCIDGLDLAWLANDPLIELTGYLEDVRPAVAGSWLALAPLLSGAGTRLKILEAMALGTPVVATRKGAEGLEVANGEHILIADEPAAFADHCLRLLESPALRQEIAAQARRLVEGRYGWGAIGEKFCALVEAVALQPGKREAVKEG
jgi:glycosyltransferase involved in cell wall biosynthesis